jgi:hypothetical protein
MLISTIRQCAGSLVSTKRKSAFTYADDYAVRSTRSANPRRAESARSTQGCIVRRRCKQFHFMRCMQHTLFTTHHVSLFVYSYIIRNATPYVCMSAVLVRYRVTNAQCEARRYGLFRSRLRVRTHSCLFMSRSCSR